MQFERAPAFVLGWRHMIGRDVVKVFIRGHAEPVEADQPVPPTVTLFARRCGYAA